MMDPIIVGAIVVLLVKVQSIIFKSHNFFKREAKRKKIGTNIYKKYKSRILWVHLYMKEILEPKIKNFVLDIVIEFKFLRKI